MSKDIIVLTPNGRRQKVQCSPDTTILKVLEDVCQKQGFQPTQYDLKHHNHVLDLTTTVRFSNLPNKATLEMVEAERKREEKNVTIGLMLEDGERRMADFPPNTCLLDLVTTLAPNELNTLQHPTIMYMRQEVTGLPALKEKTLRELGLLGGRAILRLLNKAEESRQANVSAVYRCPITEKPDEQKRDPPANEYDKPEPERDEEMPGPSGSQKKADKPFDAVKAIMDVKRVNEDISHKEMETNAKTEGPKPSKMMGGSLKIKEPEPEEAVSSTSVVSEAHLERRLNIEEEVTFLGAQKAIAFMQPDKAEEELNDLPDDFYDLTIEEVRKLYKDLQQHRMELEDTPLITSSKREELQQTSQQRIAGYKNVVVRVQFPDRIILQGVFSPTNTIQEVTNFIREHLNEPNRPFHIFTTPLKEALDPKMTLLDAKFVPCVHMHFKWINGDVSETYLKRDIYSKQTSSDAASILASKYRAPSRRKMADQTDSSIVGSTSTAAKTSKLPKWFKK